MRYHEGHLSSAATEMTATAAGTSMTSAKASA